MPDDGSLWPDGAPPRFRRSARVPRLGSAPTETSTAFEIVPTVLGLVLAMVLLVWYAVLQRQGRVSPITDRLGTILEGGAAPPGRSVAEGVCLEVQRLGGELAPVTAVLDAIGPTARGFVSVPVAWFDAQTWASVSPWLHLSHVRDAAHGLCDGARLAARAVVAGNGAKEADLVASEASFAGALASLGDVPSGDAVGTSGLGRVGRWVAMMQGAVFSHRLDGASMVALAVASGPTVAGEGRGATYLLVARAHSEDASPDAVAIASVTLRDGAISRYRVNTAEGWESQPNSVPAPTGLVGLGPERSWRLADFDWWLDFRRSGVQLLALWEAAGQDASTIDGIVAVDLAAFGDMGSVTLDDVAVVRRLDGMLKQGSASRGDSVALLSVLRQAANDGNAVVWVREPVVQAVVEARGWAGVPIAPPADQVAVVRRAVRGPRAHEVEIVGRAASGVRTDGTATRTRLVVAASMQVREVRGAAGVVEATREGEVTVLDAPVSRGDKAVIVPVG